MDAPIVPTTGGGGDSITPQRVTVSTLFRKCLDTNVHDKAAIITGAASGIGKEIARLLLAKGAQVAVAGNGIQISVKTRSRSSQLCSTC